MWSETVALTEVHRHGVDLGQWGGPWLYGLELLGEPLENIGDDYGIQIRRTRMRGTHLEISHMPAWPLRLVPIISWDLHQLRIDHSTNSGRSTEGDCALIHAYHHTMQRDRGLACLASHPSIYLSYFHSFIHLFDVQRIKFRVTNFQNGGDENCLQTAFTRQNPLLNVGS